MSESENSSSEEEEESSSSSSEEEEEEEERRKRKKKRKRSKSKKKKKKHKKKKHKKKKHKKKRARVVAPGIVEGELSKTGYTDEDNRFGDAHLSSVFVWRKKLETQDADPADLTAERLRAKQRDTQQEIERLRARRAKREQEQREREQLRDAMDREAAMADNADWEAEEEAFQRKQAVMRSQLRLEEGREKTVDILAKNLLLADGHALDTGVELKEPHAIIAAVQERERLEELLADAQGLLALGQNKPYWEAVVELCKDQLRAQSSSSSSSSSSSGAVDETVAQVHTMLANKPLDELERLEQDVTRRLSTDAAADADYWRTVLERLRVFKARAVLQRHHEELVRRSLRQLVRSSAASGAAVKREPVEEEEGEEKTAVVDEKDGAGKPEEEEREKEALCVSPPLLPRAACDAHVLEPAELRRRIFEERRDVLDRKRAAARAMGGDRDGDAGGDMVRRAAAVPLEEGEEVMSGGEAPVEVGDKYRTRRPQYVNRVKTGYDWHKFNKAHYDKDNPPPKVVQGYKFNIFYPDLIDPSTVPSFSISKDPTNDDYCVIRFSAGPPYQDIAFKIVDKPWDRSRKGSYRCVFSRGVLYLHFNFKKVFYRR